MKVEGKVVIFTGAGSGLGYECVQRNFPHCHKQHMQF